MKSPLLEKIPIPAWMATAPLQSSNANSAATSPPHVRDKFAARVRDPPTPDTPGAAQAAVPPPLDPPPLGLPQLDPPHFDPPLPVPSALAPFHPALLPSPEVVAPEIGVSEIGESADSPPLVSCFAFVAANRQHWRGFPPPPPRS